MIGITTKSYLTKSLLKKLYKQPINNDFIAEKILAGELVKHFSYYKPTVKLLKNLGVLPSQIKIQNFGKLAKETSFTQNEIMEIFDCERDLAKLILKKYFRKKYSLYYRREELTDILAEGGDTLDLS